MGYQTARRIPAIPERYEDGFSLIEVLVALVVLIAILLPVGDLLTTTSQVVAGSQYRNQAQDLAAGTLSGIESAAEGEPATFTADFGSADSPGFFLNSTVVVAQATGTSQWNLNNPTMTNQGSMQWTLYANGGWCATPGAGGGSWGTSGSGPPAFVVAVMASWGRATDPSGLARPHVVDIGSFVPSAGWSLTSTPTFAYCPAAL